MPIRGTLRVREFTDDQVTQLVRDMDEHGYACVPNLIPNMLISEARAFVLQELRKHGGNYFSYIGREAVLGSLMADLGWSDEFRSVLARIYEAGMGSPAPGGGLFQVLRVLAGKTGLKESYRFHFDAYVVTALIPIMIPNTPGERRGDLIIYPKLRGIRRSVLVNVVEKMLWQNPAGRWLARSSVMQRWSDAKVVRLRPGNAYFFWGYQSLHGNERCHPNNVRSTALFHYGDPHEASMLLSVVQRLRRLREQRMIRRQKPAPSASRP